MFLLYCFFSTLFSTTQAQVATLQQPIMNVDGIGLGYQQSTGQTFTVPITSTLNSIQVYLKNISVSSSATVTVSIYSGSLGSRGAPIDLSDPIASTSQTISSTGNTTFNFTPISLSAGNYYFNVSCNNDNYRIGGNFGGGFTDTDANGNSINEFFYQTQYDEEYYDYINYNSTSCALYFIIAFCTNPTSGGTIAAAQSGSSGFNPAAFTSTAAQRDIAGH